MTLEIHTPPPPLLTPSTYKPSPSLSSLLSLSSFEPKLTKNINRISTHSFVKKGKIEIKMEAPDFFVEDLLDLSNGGDDMIMNDAVFNSVAGNSTDSSNVTPVDSCNSSVSGHDFPSFSDHFSGDLSLPYDDMAELEWLSNFVEESFSSEDLPKFHLIPMGQQPNGPAQYQNPTRLSTPNPPTAVPGKARSKRSRVAPCDWSTRLLMVAPTSASTSSATSSSDPNPKKSSSKRRENAAGPDGPNGEVRRCLHCAAEKTPQWRTGPMGPKTLCNACGVRYKSGRLVPEYRPASSPTFVSTKHSNSHRKVVELRRQKELQRQQMVGHHHHPHHHHHHQSMIMGVSNGEDEFLIHHHLGPDYNQMI